MYTQLARWLDRTLGTLALFTVSALWFFGRSQRLWLSAWLALALTALLCYGIFLVRKRILHSKETTARSEESMRRTLYALSMLPYSSALQHTANALSRAYSLEQRTSDEQCIFLKGTNGNTIAVSLWQSPSPASQQEVFLFQKAQKEHQKVLVSVGGFDKSAQEYAAQLRPAMRLIDAKELQFPEELYFCTDHIPKTQKRTAWRVLCEQLDPARAARCMLSAFVFYVLYILTGRLSMLFPALGLTLFALLCKRTSTKPKTLF